MSALEPVTIVELSQPRCWLRFGTLPCRAALATGTMRTNYWLWSQDVNNAASTKSNIGTATTSAFDSAAGGIAQFVPEASNTASHAWRQDRTITSGAVQTIFAIARENTSGSKRYLGLSLASAASASSYVTARFDLATGAVTLQTAVGAGFVLGAVTVQALGDGFYLCAMTGTISTATDLRSRVYFASSGTTITGASAGMQSYLGNGSGLIIGGVQQEDGSGASPYKVTEGTAVSELFGTAAARCYQTWTTCADRDNFDPSGSIRWRFVKNRPGFFAIGDFADEDAPATNALPMLVNVSSMKGQVNVAGILDGKSPFGIRSGVTVTLQDMPWDDHIGDFYRSLRTLGNRTFWAVWNARNSFYAGMTLRIYDGYAGEALADMRQRVYLLEKVDGPDASGRVTLTGTDPLKLSDGKAPKFPRTMDVKLTAAIDDEQDTIQVTTTQAADLTDAFGNTAEHYARIGDEIISYTTATEVTPGTYDLTGVLRGQLTTTAAEASEGDKFGRVGRYVDLETWKIFDDLLTNHTQFDAAYRDYADWEAEAGVYLSTLRSTVTIAEPVDVEQLCGEACQQGMFAVWWSEYDQTVKLQAVRPPRGPVTQLDGASHIVKDSARLTTEPTSRVTRVFVYYDPRSPLASVTDPANYRTINGTIEGDTESANAGGEVKERTIFARFVNAEAHAIQIVSRILSRYRDVPRFLSLHVAAKDRTVTIGDVCDVLTREIVDSEGNIRAGRWQVIGAEEIVAGEVYLLDMQTYDLTGRFAVWMADVSPDYDTATEDERALGAWWADDNGLMPDGTRGYQWQ